MSRRPILEKSKKKKSLGWFLLLLIILGFIASVILFGTGAINEIIHP